MRSTWFLFILMGCAIFINPACNASRRTKGAIIGATAGGATAGVIAKKNKAVWIIAGAAVGGVAGGLIGDYMDKQAAKIDEDLEGAKVERVGEGILITFESGILFDFDSYALKAETRSNLQKLSITLNKYDDTEVLVLGHTDNTGTENYNEALSEKRARSVKNYLVTQQVAGSRLSTQGYGETDPIADNETAEGRQLNRRVEIVIVANKKLQRAAKRGDIGE
ncbi:MAG TPA: OmpA family protein [Saprospiraceae bacterium]|nr:OmpA family protein [Saprospiraceae bacterium]